MNTTIARFARHASVVALFCAALATPLVVHGRASGIANRAIDPAQIGNFALNDDPCVDGEVLTWDTARTPDGWSCEAAGMIPGADSVNGTELADTVTLDAAFAIESATFAITIDIDDNNATAVQIRNDAAGNAAYLVFDTGDASESITLGSAEVDLFTVTLSTTGTASVALPNGAIGLLEIDPAACAATELMRVNAGGTAWECTAPGAPGPDSVTTTTILDDTIALADIADTLVSDANLDIDFDAGNDTLAIHLDEANAAALLIENAAAADFLLIDTTADAMTIGHGASSVAIVSSGMDVSAAGAVSNVTTLAMTGALTGATDITGSGTVTGTTGGSFGTLTATGNVDLGNGGNTIGLGTSADDVTIGAEIMDTDLAFEGTTNNGTEAHIVITDPTVGDGVFTIPDLAAGSTVAFMVSSLSTNAPAAANSVTGASNALHFEGVTGGDGFQVIVQPGADPGADVTLSLPTATGNLVGTGDTTGVTGTMITDDTIDFADVADAPTLDANFTLNPSTFTFTQDIVNNGAAAALWQNDTGGADYLAFVTTTGAEQVVVGSAEVDAVIVTTDAWVTTDVGTDGDYDSFTVNLDEATADVLIVQTQAGDDFLNFDTDVDAMAFGNAVTNPTYGFLGTGLLTITPAATVTGTFTANGDAALNGTVLTVGNAVTDGVTINAAIQGASPLILDGATDAGGFETTIGAPDVGADQTVSIPDNSAADATTAFFISTEAANAIDGANGTWAVSNGLRFEGSADGFESTLSAVDPTVGDQVFELPDTAVADTYTVAVLDFAQTFTSAQTFPALTATGDVTMNDAGADTILIGAAADAVTVRGTVVIGNAADSVAIADAQWAVTTAGAATFVAVDGAAIGSINPQSATFTTLTSQGTVNLSDDAGADGIDIGDSLDTVNIDGNIAVTDNGQWSVSATGVAVFTSVTMGTWTMANSETIDNAVNGAIELQGAGGGDNTDLRIDLDGTNPVIDSPTDAAIGLAEDSIVFGASATHDLALSAGIYDFGRSTSGTVTFTASDDDATAAVVYDAGGAAAITVGSADVLGIDLRSTVNAIAGSATNVSITNGATGAVTLDFRDFADTTDDDMSHVLLTANCTATGAAAEDCDFSISVVEGGAAPDARFNIDANGSVTVGSAATNAINLTTDSTGDAELTVSADSIGFAEVDNTQTIGANPTNGADSVWFGTTGLVWEGTASDTNELLLTAPALAGDVTITLPTTTGNLVGPGDSSTVTSGMIANVTRSISIPLRSFIDCQTDAGAEIGYTSGADTLANYSNSATDGLGFVIRFDDTGGTEDQNSEICSNWTVPADYASGGSIRFRYLKDADTGGGSEIITTAVSINGAALGSIDNTNCITSGATSSTCTTTPGGAYAANDSVSVSVSITSGGTMNDQVDLQSVSFEYTATQ